MQTKEIDPQIQAIYDDIATYQAIAKDDYGVPQWQALPLASAPSIAFRPSCDQIETIWQADDTTAWVWQGQTIYTTPGQLHQGSLSTLLNLQAAGVCVVGSHAVDVPLVPTDEVFTKFEQQVSGPVAALPEPQPSMGGEPAADVVTTSQASVIPWGGLSLLAGLVLAAGVALWLRSKFGIKKKQMRKGPGKGKSKVSQEDLELIDKLYNKTQSQPITRHPEAPTDLEQEYDFRL